MNGENKDSQEEVRELLMFTRRVYVILGTSADGTCYKPLRLGGLHEYLKTYRKIKAASVRSSSALFCTLNVV